MGVPGVEGEHEVPEHLPGDENGGDRQSRACGRHAYAESCGDQQRDRALRGSTATTECVRRDAHGPGGGTGQPTAQSRDEDFGGTHDSSIRSSYYCS